MVKGVRFRDHRDVEAARAGGFLDGVREELDFTIERDNAKELSLAVEQSLLTRKEPVVPVQVLSVVHYGEAAARFSLPAMRIFLRN